MQYSFKIGVKVPPTKEQKALIKQLNCANKTLVKIVHTSKKKYDSLEEVTPDIKRIISNLTTMTAFDKITDLYNKKDLITKIITH